MIGKGLEHSIESYKATIARYKLSGVPLLLSFVGPMERTLKGLLDIKFKVDNK